MTASGSSTARAIWWPGPDHWLDSGLNPSTSLLVPTTSAPPATGTTVSSVDGSGAELLAPLHATVAAMTITAMTTAHRRRDERGLVRWVTRVPPDPA